MNRVEAQGSCRVSHLRCFQVLDRKNWVAYVMQRIEDTNERRLVCQLARQDRHRTMMRIVRMLDRHAPVIIGPILVQGAQDTDPYIADSNKLLLGRYFSIAPSLDPW